MNLTTEQILSALKGAPAARVENGLVIPERYRDEQRENFGPHIYQRGRSYCHASVTLDFYTDSRTMVLYYKNTWNESDFPPFFFDVYENGIMTQRLGFAHKRRDFEKEPDGQMMIPLTAGEKRVTVYLTNLFHVELARVTLDDGATFRPYTHRGRFLAFGDSITEGFQATVPSMTYVNALSRLMDYEAVNYGIGGDAVRPEAVLPGTYPDCDFVTVAMGTNDLPNAEEADFRQRVIAYHDRFHEAFPDKPVFILTPIFRFAKCAEQPAGHLKHFSAILAESARRYDNFRVIDGLTLIPPEKFLYHDKTHPNVGGFAVMAINLKVAIEGML